jgi:hypothetical protein
MGKRTYTYDGSDWVGLTSTTADLSNYANMTNTPISGFRNVLINGDFKVWQRGTSFTYSSGQPYTADRWCTTPSGTAAYSVSRQTASLTGTQYCLRLQRTASNTNTSLLYLSQPIETVNSIPLAGTTVSFSFYARAGANYSAASSALNVRLVTGTGTDGNYLVSSLTGQATPLDTTATLTTSWQRFTYTASIASNVNQIQPSFFYTPVGTAGANDYFEITEVQLEPGTLATPFEQRPIGTELALCQRYYEVASQFYGRVMSCYDSSAAYASIEYVVPKRRIPDISVTNGANASGWAAYGGGGTKTITSILVNFVFLDSWQLRVLGSFSAGQAIHLDSPASNTFFYSAEL